MKMNDGEARKIFSAYSEDNIKDYIERAKIDWISEHGYDTKHWR